MNNKIILFLTLFLLIGCKESILHDLGESDANRILTRLHSSGIVTEKEKQADGRWSITVPKKNAPQALQLLAEARVFRRAQRTDNRSSSLLSSREEQRFHFERALSREIESTLISLDGVLEARVHMNLPPTDPLFGKRFGDQEGSGSAMLVVAQNFLPQRNEIALLISGASGIEPSKISVLLAKENGGLVRTSEGSTPPVVQSTGENFVVDQAASIQPQPSPLPSPLWDSISWHVAALALGFISVCIPFIYRKWMKEKGVSVEEDSHLFGSLFEQTDKEEDDINISEDSAVRA